VTFFKISEAFAEMGLKHMVQAHHYVYKSRYHHHDIAPIGQTGINKPACYAQYLSLALLALVVSITALPHSEALCPCSTSHPYIRLFLSSMYIMYV